MTDVFQFKNCSDYLLSVFGDKSQRRGLKSKAAQAIGCHTTLISQVLHGKVLLNLEQAEKLSRFFGHDEDQAHFFLLLVQKARAGTKSLESYFQKQMDGILSQRQILKKRVGATDQVLKEQEQKYYSSWIYAALHVAVSLSNLKSAEALARHFKLPLNQVNEALQFLVKAGFVTIDNKGDFQVGSRHLHLGNNSVHINHHHRNWRIKTLQALESPQPQNLHYSSAVTLSHEDVATIKELLIENLKKMNKTIQASKEETVYVLNFDFFAL